MKKYESRWSLHFIVSAFLMVINSGAWVLVGYLSGQVVDYAISGELRQIVSISVYIVMVFTFAYATTLLSQHIILKASAGILYTVNTELVSKLYKGGIQKFRSMDDAYYVNMAVTDSGTLFASRYYNLPKEVGAAFKALIAFGVLFYISFWIFIVSIVFAIFPMLISKMFTKYIQERRLQSSKADEAFVAAITEAVQGYENIKLSGTAKGYFQRINTITEKMCTAIKRDWFMVFLSSQVQFSMNWVFIIIVICLGGFLITTGQMTAGELLSASFILQHVSEGVSNFFVIRAQRRSTDVIRNKFANEFDTNDEWDKALNVIISNTPEIAYENVTFGFEQKNSLFENFSFTFQHGGIYAVIGESGSGKSSLLKLLLKYYSEYDGKILIDGHDIRSIDESIIYSLIGVVNQQPFIINDTFIANITMHDNPKADIQSLLKDLSLEGLSKRVGDAPLGDFGDNISGGERQRIAIARALVKTPKIIIFDEPTTGLDPENTKLINDYIFSLKGITRIVISHDWSEDYLSRFDKVIDLKR